MAYVTGDPQVDALLEKHAEEIGRRENLAKELAAENDRLIARIEARRAKRAGVVGGR